MPGYLLPGGGVLLRRRLLRIGHVLLSQYRVLLSHGHVLLRVQLLHGRDILLSGPGDVLCHGFGMLRGGLLRREHSGEHQRGLLRQCVLR